ncbi:MAG: hypothetical protein AAGC55_02025 [Myxococcota bacterium]
MRILIDLDGIVHDFNRAFIDHYNSVADEMASYHCPEWRFDHLANKAARMCTWEWVRHEPFWRSVPLLSEVALSVIRGWHDAGDEIIIVTAPMNGASARVKWERFHAEFDFLDRGSLILGKAKHLVAGDMLIDDKPANLLAYREHWPRAELATISWPYQDSACEEMYQARVYCCGFWDEPDAAWGELDEQVAYYRGLRT